MKDNSRNLNKQSCNVECQEKEKKQERVDQVDQVINKGKIRKSG